MNCIQDRRVIMRKFDNNMNDIDFTDCMEAMKQAFKEKLNNEIKRRRRWDDSNKKLNINIQLHMTIEKE